MANSAPIDEVRAFYSQGVEAGRLQRGIGKLEWARTVEVLARCLPPAPAVVYDVGGATGAYSLWLAERGYEAHLFDLVESNVTQARKASRSARRPLASAEVADGRKVDRPAASADAVLVMGPLYHLVERRDRLDALREAHRVLRERGVLVAAGIGRLSSLLWSVSVYGRGNELLGEPEFQAMVARELRDGQHIRPARYPNLIARSFFHTPGELQAEVAESGFRDVEVVAVEGPAWLVPDFSNAWEDERRREPILRVARALEREPSVIGASPHLLATATK